MLQLRVEAIKIELPGTATFFLAKISGEKIHYKAGQFITLVFNHHEEEIRRSYSLSSSPHEALLAITVKRIENGEISRFMLTRVKKGDILTVVEPAGRFTIEDYKSQKDIFLFAAGSGIVPIFSQLKYILSHKGDSRLILIYSNQNEQSVLFKDELGQLADAHPERLTIIHLLSNEANRLNNLVTEQLVQRNAKYDLANAGFYTCGPFTYMRMIRLTLLFMGIGSAQIRKENFVLETVPVPDSEVNFPPQTVRIHFRDEIYDITVGENQSILQAALQNQIPLAYSCRVGDCSTCAAKCTSGKVQMIKNDILTDADLADGWVLTCTGYPLTDDVVIEY